MRILKTTLKTNLKRCAVCLAAAALLGCASKPPVQTTMAYARIALLPVQSPQAVYTENRMFAVPVLPAIIANSAANRIKSADFDAHMAAGKAQLGPLMQELLLEALAARGLQVHVLDGFRRDPADPDAIEYETLPTRDAVLHVMFADVAMDSSRLSSTYAPRLQVDAVLRASPRAPDEQQQYLTYQYGADLRADARWAIAADPKYRYPNFDSLLARRDEITQSWREAVREIARRVAEDIRKPQSAIGR